MKLAPVESTREPAYPTYHRALKRVAAAVAASAALMLPACGDVDSDGKAKGFDPEPQIQQVRLPGDVPVHAPPPPEAKPPESPPPVVPESPPRLSGAVAPSTPPQQVDTPPVRLAGRRPAPRPPRRPTI